MSNELKAVLMVKLSANGDLVNYELNTQDIVRRVLISRNLPDAIEESGHIVGAKLTPTPAGGEQFLGRIYPDGSGIKRCFHFAFDGDA
jgi:hypothetical protein